MKKAVVYGLAGVMAGALIAVPSAGVSVSSESPAPPAGSNQRFLLLNTNPAVEGGPIVGFGNIHARGHDVVLGPRRDRFVFPNGNIVIRHRPHAGSGTERFDPRTCYFKFTETGRWWVLRGTGAYAGATGNGTYRALGQGLGRRMNGQCTEKRPPRVFMFRISAPGNVHF